jgi:hypothetical protein
LAPADIVIGEKDVVEVLRASEFGRDALARLTHYAEAENIRHAALIVAGSLIGDVAEPWIERVKTPAGRDTWIVHL